MVSESTKEKISESVSNKRNGSTDGTNGRAITGSNVLLNEFITDGKRKTGQSDSSEEQKQAELIV